ncbi:MAG: hypothetical protein DBY43_05015 [Clostridiaceae bacterium]|nr:MAG: hypothetical protein DBY43_05015 [Clostridiaceae bacterium]
MNKQAELTRWTPKRLLSLLMALIMTLSLLPTAAFAAEGDPIVLSAAHWEDPNKTQQLSSYTYSDSSKPNFGFFLGIGFDNFTPSTNLYPGAEVEIPFKCNFTGTLSPQKITFTFKDLNSPHGTSIEDSATMFSDGHTGTLSASVGGDGSLRFTVQSSYTLKNGTSGSSDLVTVQIKDLVPASTWQVKFHMNDGTGAVYSSVPVQGGYGTTRPSDPTREGYKFAGWHTEANSGSPYDFGAPVTADTNVYAHWTADGTTQAGSHTVNFLPGAADAYIPFVATATVKDGTNYTIPTNKPAREGYEFNGWSIKSGTATLENGQLTNVTSDVTLEAQWVRKRVNVVITKDTDDVTVLPTNTFTGTVGKAAHFGVTVPAKYDAAKMTVLAGTIHGEHKYLVPESQHIADNGNITFYYQFTVTEGMFAQDPDTGEQTLPVHVGAVTEKTFNVTLPTGERFDAAFTAVPNASIPAGKELADLTNVTVAYGGSVSFTVTEREGWTIKNVYDNGAAIKAVDGKYTIANIQADHKIEVNVEQTIFYNVTYAVPGFSSWTQSYQSGTKLGKTADTNNKITALATMIPPTGYTWDGNWYMDAECTTPITDEKPLTVNSDVTVYAKFAPKTVTISYKSGNDTAKVNGTEIPATSKTYGLGAQLTAATPDKAEQGYTFLGWSENPSATAPAYKSGEMYNVDTENNVTLYAVWEKQTFNISLSSGTGYSIHHTQPLQVEYGDTFSFRVAMSKGYSQTAPSVWMNWVDAAGTEHSHQLTNPTETTDGTSGLAVYHYTTPEIYWNATINVVSAADLVYTVTYKYAGLDGRTEYPKNDDTYLTQNVSWNEAAAQPAAPSVEGYKFVGWTTDNNAQYDFTAPVTSDLTIYAVFSAVQPTITRTKANTGTGWKTTGWKWTKDTKINAVANDGGAFFVDYGSDVEFTLNIEEGYDASGVTVSVNGKLLLPYGDATVDGNVTKITYKLTNVTEDSEIVVVGVARKEVKITYYANATDDVEHVPGQQTVKYYLAGNGDNGKLDSAKPTRVGYAFKGWSTDPAASPDAANLYQPGGDATFTSDTNLYAIWEAQELTATLTFSNTALHTDNYDIQYEGKEFALNAKLTARAKGTAIFLVGTENDISKAKQIGEPVTVNSDTASLTVIAGKYVTPSDQNLKYYWVKFQSETAEGYTDCESGPIALKIFSRAITWTPLTDGNSGTLTIKDKDGNTKDAMIAGQTYTLTVNTDKIIGLEALDKDKPTLGNDYYIVWQYKKTATGDWETVNGNFTDTKQYQVTPGESGYEFRAKVYPKGELYNTAAKFNESGAFVNNEYDDCLYTSTTKSDLQETAITLTVVAPSEASNVKINGSAPFTDIGDHKAQFEGQTVTLTAKVTDTTTGTPAVTTGHVNFYRKGAAADTLLNASPIAVGTNGVATCEVEISKWTDGKDVTENKDEFYAVYLANATYDTSDSKTTPQTVYIKSTTIQTPIIESKLEGEGGKKATTYTDDLTGLLAGVEHTFELRVGNDKADWSVVALDGRTVDAKNYTIQWITKSGDNAETTAATDSKFKTSDNKVGDEIYVRLNPTGDMKTGADSKKAIIGKKQDVTVAVEASDEIASTPVDRAAKKFPDVYQLNEIELTATVKGYDSETMTPTGTVKFYYKDRQVTPNTFVYLGEAALAKGTDGKMHASIKTDKLPVDKDNNTKLDVVVCAAYFGDDTFAASRNVNATTGNIASAGSTGYVTYDTVTVYSSVVFAGDSENKAAAQSNYGITITANGALKANESSVTLTLGQVYTLDHPIDLSKLTYNTDYTVQWQILKNALQHQDSSAGSYATTDKWEDLPNQTGSSYTGTMEQDAAYRAKITVKDTPIAKGSFDEVTQANPGRKVYYSNVLVVGAGMATVTTNITTSANQKFNEEGIVSGETATIHVLASGAAKTTPISTVTATITKSGAPDPVFNEKANNVNGYTSFAWDTANLTPGYYTLTVTAESNNGYAPQTITRTLIVRDNAYTLTATKESKVYNGKAQGIDWTLTGVDIENALAQKSVVVYYTKDGKMVEPTQAGEYQYDLYLPASAYWTELTHITGTFIIEKRPVEVVDLVAQAKVYDGTNNANIQEIILNDSAVDSNGTATGNTGIIDGDSVYAVGIGYTSQATAGTADLGVKNVTLKGDDAANYVPVNSGHTEKFNIQRSQVKGAIVSGRTYKYTGKDIKLAASDIYLIDQAGNQLTNYDVTYYYHNGDGVEKVDAMNKMGKYTVIARPEQNNYKGGATETVYVGNTDTPGTLNNGAKSSLITISNTVELYGATNGVTVSATKGTATASYYYDGAWKDTAPIAAGRYLVKATVTNGSVTDTAYGIYTIVKARPEFTPTTNKANMEYTSGRYDGTVVAGFVSGKSTDTAETYITYTGGTIQGVAYEAPTEVGKYIATVHVGETANYTAHEEQVAFEITPKALTIKADDLQRWQYGSFPDMVASYQGLATDGIAADTSLRDVQIQPEFLFNEKDGGYTNHAYDQVGTYPVTVRNALARNYTVTYKDGKIATTAEEPKAKLAIHGMPDNGTATENLVYYGDTIQLYAYGYYKTIDSNNSSGSYNTSSLIEWSVSDASIAEIDQSGLLTIKGVGTFTVTLTRGSGSAAISTDINVVANPKEVSIDVPDVDKVYTASEQTYNSTPTVNGLINSDSVTPTVTAGTNKRTVVGSQITSYKVATTKYVSETYGGLFTINVKDVTVKPIEATTPYGTAVTGLDYSENTPAGTDKVLTNGMAVSVADAYSNLDVLDGYEILVAGKENENYNVKYETDQDALDVEVTAKDLTISTGTLNEQTGMTSGSLNPEGKYPVNGAAIDDPAPAMGPSNVRMYGEPNWVMDYKLDEHELITGDTLADLAALNGELVSFNYNIGADANVSYTDKATKLTVSGSPMPDYKVFTDDSMMAFKNYDETYTLGTQNIYQRPVTLSVPSGMTLTAYKPSILDSSNQVKNDVLLNLLLNNLIVSKYNNEGGLAELLKHTIKDLDIRIKSTQVTGDKLTVKIALGNQNYWLNSANEQTFEITLVTEKIVPKYSTLDWTSFSVTMYDAEGKAPVSVNGAVNFYIFKKKDGADLKYSDYKNDPIIRSGPMTPTGSTGQYVASFERLPAGEYAYFAIAQNYTIVE